MSAAILESSGSAKRVFSGSVCPHLGRCPETIAEKCVRPQKIEKASEKDTGKVVGNGTVIDCGNVSGKLFLLFETILRAIIYFRKMYYPNKILGMHESQTFLTN
jgi:hypothetical protein